MEIRISKNTKKGITHFKMEIGELELHGNFSTTPQYEDDQQWYVGSGDRFVASGYCDGYTNEWQTLNDCVNYEDIKRLVLLGDLSCLEDLLWQDCSQLLLKWELAKKFGRVNVLLSRQNGRKLP